MKNNVHELYALEDLSHGDTVVHRLHPSVKLIASAVFIITVVSFDRYAFGQLVPLVFFPTLLMALSETPYSMLLKRFLLALPFCLFAGVTNVIFDTAAAFTVSGIIVSYGVVSFCTIMFRAYLCVMAVLILVSVTPFSELTGELRRFRVPGIFVVMFEMTYRYIGVLFGEAYSMYLAYTIRSTNAKGIAIKDMGSFVGQLLLRSFDRAERIYSSMKCRGYTFRVIPRSRRRIELKDCVFLTVVCVLCATVRFVDIGMFWR